MVASPFTMKRLIAAFLLLNVKLISSSNGRENLSKDMINFNQDFEELLITVMHNNLQPFKCVTIICDDIYCELFQGPFFKAIKHYVPFFIILVEDSEDLLSPYNETQEALIMAKRQDCQMYIVLISNGLQVSRLLRFGDKYRSLDTRSNFVFLYDQRLFESNLLYLWKRIVNVIFIREYIGLKSRGGNKISMPWFEISTVPFPSPIFEIYVPRRLDIWRQSKFRTGTDLFRDKTSNLRNQELHVVTFEHVPATKKIPIPEFKTYKSIYGDGTLGFSGLEIEILHTISKEMNFRPYIYEPENAITELWGRREVGGQYSGLFGEMISSRADVALGDLYYTPSILQLMDLSTPYYTECLTFLTPESLSDNSWKTLILPFQPLMWAAVIVCLLVSGYIFNLLAKFYRTIDAGACVRKIDIDQFKKKKIIMLPLQPYVEKWSSDLKYALMKSQFETTKVEGEPEGLYLFADFVNSMLYTFSVLLMVSLPKLPTGWSLRILTGFYWVYCLLVVVAYKASLTAILASPAPRVTIDKLQELVDAKLSYGGWGEINREFFQTSLDPASQMIGSKFEMINDSDSAVDRVASGDFAFYENVNYLKHASVKRQLRLELSAKNDTSNKNPENPGEMQSRNLHIMEDCIINMPISIGLQKNSPILRRFNKYVRRIIEAGLVQRWLDDVMQTTFQAVNTETTESTKALMSFSKMLGAFVALFIGYFLSLIVLSCEISYFHFVIKKHPNYNKYSKNIIKF